MLIVADFAPDAQSDPRCSLIVERLNGWRFRQRLLGSTPYDEPDWESGRLHFRSGYVDGLHEWAKLER